MTSARPASGDSSVARTRTSVVLPAPFGPSSPKIAPSGTSRSTPASASVEPKLLVTPSTAMADVVKRQTYPVGAVDLDPRAQSCVGTRLQQGNVTCRPRDPPEPTPGLPLSSAGECVSAEVAVGHDRRSSAAGARR